MTTTIDEEAELISGSWAPPKSTRERQYESAYRRALADALTWIERSTGTRLSGRPQQPDAAYPPGLFRQLLSDGVQLCELLNALRPGCVKKINRSKNRIAGLDNLALFIQICDQVFNVPKLSMFDVTDVVEDLSEKYNPEDAVYEDERRCKKILTCLLRLHRFVDLRPSTPRLELSALMAVLGGGGGGGGSRPSSAGSGKRESLTSDAPPAVQLTQSVRTSAAASNANPLQFVKPEGNKLVQTARHQIQAIQRNKEELAETAAAKAAAAEASSDADGDAWISVEVLGFFLQY
uniref:Calponin-homology (CH) domain-containing protein n=1 Tax=Macrostomum lignano TaxID=282301 RepID=A0A1I8HEY3_9PLAT